MYTIMQVVSSNWKPPSENYNGSCAHLGVDHDLLTGATPCYLR